MRWIILLIGMLSAALPALANTITIKPEKLDLGDFRLGTTEDLKGFVEVTNHSDEIMRLEKLEVSCSCLRVVGSFQLIQPGETKPIKLRVKPENNAQSVSMKRLSMTFRGQETVHRSALVSWKVSHPIVATPANLSFIKMKPGERRVSDVRLQAASPNVGLEFAIKSVHVSYPFVKTTVINNEKIRLEVTIPAEFESKREAQLVVTFDSEQNDLPELRLPITVARVPLPVQVTPRSISLFEKPPPDGRKVTVRVFHRDKRPTMIDSVEVRKANAEEGTLATGRSGIGPNEWLAHVDLIIHPTTPGSQETVRITLRESPVSFVEVVIRHAYH